VGHSGYVVDDGWLEDGAVCSDVICFVALA